MKCGMFCSMQGRARYIKAATKSGLVLSDCDCLQHEDQSEYMYGVGLIVTGNHFGLRELWPWPNVPLLHEMACSSPCRGKDILRCRRDPHPFMFNVCLSLHVLALVPQNLAGGLLDGKSMRLDGRPIHKRRAQSIHSSQ